MIMMTDNETHDDSHTRVHDDDINTVEIHDILNTGDATNPIIITT